MKKGRPAPAELYGAVEDRREVAVRHVNVEIVLSESIGRAGIGLRFGERIAQKQDSDLDEIFGMRALDIKRDSRETRPGDKIQVISPLVARPLSYQTQHEMVFSGAGHVFHLVRCQTVAGEIEILANDLP